MWGKLAVGVVVAMVALRLGLLLAGSGQGRPGVCGTRATAGGSVVFHSAQTACNAAG